MSTREAGRSESISPEDVRAEVRQWAAEAWSPALSLRQWRDRFVDSGWAMPHWPQAWFGRNLPAWAEDVVRSEIARCGAVASIPAGLAAPTILEHGPDAMRARFLRPMLVGAESWCQLFSEPSAGSDLAGLTTTAVRDGDDWVINGQKVWNTSADHADFGMLLARTDWQAPKHKGITYFVLPMKQPGVEVRPLRQMNYHASFMEVFLTDARVPADWVVGDVDDGWRVARTTLAHERRFRARANSHLDKAAPGPALDEARAEAAEQQKVYKWYPQRAGRPDLAVSHAQAAGVNADPLVRQEIAKLLAYQLTGEWTAARAKALRAVGLPPGPEGSIGKLNASRVARQAANVHAMIAGAHAMLAGDDPESPLDGVIAEILISTPAQSIAGGTDEIQRNILAERFLGLPREQDPSIERPYREVRNS